ncbi:MAG: ERCC4 domain-containing protein [Candidatus Aenigmatarchaeota archaeon]
MVSKFHDNIIIYADTRELSSRIAKILSKHCVVNEKQLPVADYLLSERVAVERKRIPDFLQSIVDGRLFEQLCRMKDQFEKPVLIIEGNENMYDERKIHPNAINGALAAITIDMSISIIWTKNNLETARMLFTIAKREQLDIKSSNCIRGKIKPKSLNQEQEFLLAGLPKINSVLARRLLKHFRSPEKVFLASEDDLQEVEGIGEKLAKKIKRILGSKYERSVLEG